MTIEEKARKIACGNCNICKGEPQPCGGSNYRIYQLYLQSAKEQQEVDIQRAKEHICKICADAGMSCQYPVRPHYGCKSLSDVEQAMKGE